ncbi:MAG: hypothetical protein ACKV2V_26390 [Blastocatellia bacterium]
MRIARIIRSNSHVDYVARVIDSLESAAPPSAMDYPFGQFVSVACAHSQAVGVIYNSQLINPDYGNSGPRLSSPPELNSVFSPDYLHEQGVLLGILLLGSAGGAQRRQGVPREVAPVNANVEVMDEDAIRAFHGNAAGALELRYYAHVVTHGGLFAFQLLDTIVERLEQLGGAHDRARLHVLRGALAWQQTMGTMR